MTLDDGRRAAALKLLNEWRRAANNVDAPDAFESTRKIWLIEEEQLREEILQLMGVNS